MSPTLKNLYGTFGQNTVLLPIAMGSKNPGAEGWKGWQNTTVADSQKPEYQQQLEECVRQGGNIGVLLGPASSGLVSIDMDRDDLIDPLIEISPILAFTTRTRSRRGCNFFLRVKPGTAYPNSQAVYTLRDKDGVKCGEWRCGGGSKGAQTVIFGVHPEGQIYQIEVDASPIEEVIFDTDLQWFYPFDSPGPSKAKTNGAGVAAESAPKVNHKGNRQADDDAAKEERAAKREAAAYGLAASLDVYYDQDRKEFLLCEGSDQYQSLNESQFKRALRFHRINDELLDFRGYSQVDIVLRELQKKKFVAYAGPLSGRDRGYYFENGFPLLVTCSPKIIEPTQGKWETLKTLFCNLYWSPGEPYGDEQRIVFYGWLQTAFNALLARRWYPGQALAFAGPANAGKSLTQRLITVILGGRIAKAALFLQGRTDFNGELFGAEHLMMEDEAASTRMPDRLAFAAALKEISANQTHACHAKHRQTVNLNSWWRVTASLNDTPERLLILPPIDDDTRDKLIIIRALAAGMPMPTETPEDKKKFWEQLTSELPAFLYYLTAEFEIPAEWRSPRFGIKHFHHPMLLKELEDLDPAVLLLELIDTANIWYQWDPATKIRGATVPWEGTALELRRVLMSNTSTRNDASSLLKWVNSTGKYLNKLAVIKATRVKFVHGKHQDTYEIYP